MKIDRLVSIIMLLMDKKRMSAQDLADMFEVSPRTIYRDIDAIAMAGIPIRSTPGVCGGFEIMEEYTIDKGFFSPEDLSAILMGLSGLTGMMKGDELVNALAKVKGVIPPDRAKDIELRASQVYIDVSPWIGQRNLQPYLEIIKTAIQEQRVVTFEYMDRRGTRTVRTTEPYQLILKGSHWYWQGYCRTRKDFRLFKISRMSALEAREELFASRPCPKPELNIQDRIESLQRMITLRVHVSVLERVLDFCEYEHCTPAGGEYWRVSFPFIENDYYYSILLSFGAQCECLEPPHVRKELLRKVQAIASVYEGERLS